jgi:hypothetical protein
MIDPNTEPDAQQAAIDVDREKGNFRYKEDYAYDAGVGLTPATVDYIAKVKGEDEWVRAFRHKALGIFESMPMPTHWATRDLDNIRFEDIRYYLAKGQKPSRTWEEVPDDVKQTFERLGIPESERKFLAGVEAQFDSEAAYSNMKADLEKLGVIFVGPTEGLRERFGKTLPSIRDRREGAFRLGPHAFPTTRERLRHGSSRQRAFEFVGSKEQLHSCRAWRRKRFFEEKTGGAHLPSAPLSPEAFWQTCPASIWCCGAVGARRRRICTTKIPCRSKEPA